MERNSATSDDSEMSSSNLLQCPVQVSLIYMLLKLVTRMESCICLHLFQFCWLVCMIPATNQPSYSSFLKTMGDSCYVLFCTLCSRCVDKLLNGIELEELFPWLCWHFVVTVARYFLNVLSIKINHRYEYCPAN